MIINLIKMLIGTLSEKDKDRLYELLGVVVKSAVEGAVHGAIKP